MLTPTYSVVIPWCDREEIVLTLQKNTCVYERHRAEIIVVNAGGDFGTLMTLLGMAGVPNVRSVDLPGAAFNRSLCANIGTLVSRGERIFLLDADIVLDSDVLADANPHLEDRSRYVTIKRIAESNLEVLDEPDAPDYSFLHEMRETRELVTVDGRRAVLSSVTSPRGVRNGHGLVLLRKRDLMAIGGLNSTLTGWGYEDTDLQLRLQFMLGLERIEAGEVTHLTHSSASRDERSWMRNMVACTRNYSRRNYRGSIDDDARMWRGRLRANAVASHAGPNV